MTDYRLVTYRTPKGRRAGIVAAEQLYDAAAATREPRYASVLGILQDWKAANALLRKASLRKPVGALKKMKLLAPLPNPGTLFCAGANYTDHMEEMLRAQNRPP